jgi:NAD+ kinase
LGLAHLADERDPRVADVAVALGGDGTVLRCVKLLDGAPAPVIGVNLGQLGYLTEVEPPGLPAALERWFAGSDAGGWEIEERMMLSVAVRRAGSSEADERWTALNEAVVEKREPGHTVRMRVHIDGATFTSYAADGIIIATPTGSTAYSLSARGPVVSPRHRALLLTPVSPHMLFDRSLVLDPDETIDVELTGHRAATLTVDGQRAADLCEGDTVLASAAPHAARFVRFGTRHFHQTLKAKFGLSDR